MKTEQGGLKVEKNNIPFEDDVKRLTREVESLKLSVQTLEKDREEHISIMRHLVHDMSQNRVELSDIVRERLDRHAPTVLHKRSPTQHVHTYPYTPSPSSATPTVVKRERDASLKTWWIPPPFTALAQDISRSDCDSSLSPAKRPRTDFAALDDARFSIAPDSSQSAASICTPLSLTTPILRSDQPVRKQATPRYNHDQSLPGFQYAGLPSSKEPEMTCMLTPDRNPSVMSEDDGGIRRRPSSDPVRPARIKQSSSIKPTTENFPSYEFDDNLLKMFATDRTSPASNEALDTDPLEWQDSTQDDTAFTDDLFDTSFCDTWTSRDNSFPP